MMEFLTLDDVGPCPVTGRQPDCVVYNPAKEAVLCNVWTQPPPPVTSGPEYRAEIISAGGPVVVTVIARASSPSLAAHRAAMAWAALGGLKGRG